LYLPGGGQPVGHLLFSTTTPEEDVAPTTSLPRGAFKGGVLMALKTWRRFGTVLIVLVTAAVAFSEPTVAITADWNQYLAGVEHHSYQPSDTTITPGNASTLVRVWSWIPDLVRGGPPRKQVFSSPTVVGGTIYIGANTGDFYALDDSTGAVIWKDHIGFQAMLTCKARGFTSTAAVVTDPLTQRLTVYVAAGDGYLYALDASDGSIVWKSLVVQPGTTSNEGYNWASPVVSGGHVFMGVSSQCDDPLIRGGVKEYDQETGALLGTYWTVPDGSVGGSVWSSVATTSDGSDAFATTGNADTTPGANPGDSFSIVRLNGTTLQKEDVWTIPGLNGTDKDFGASPTLFTGTIGGMPSSLVGACNKNGKFYALRANDLAAGPVWTRKVGGAMCLPAAVYDGSRLFVSGDTTTIAGTSYRGSVRELNPSSGRPLWETGLNGHIVGTPALNGSNVLAAPVYDFSSSATKGVVLLNANDGSVLTTLPTAGKTVWAQPVFADGHLFVGTIGDGLYAFAPGA
jgi:polyvinyl alcohol dehydrogenase (cytochrome)